MTADDLQGDANAVGLDRRSRQRADMTRLAAGILEKDGLAGLQARRLAERGTCAVGTVYNLFGDLDGVIFAANEETMREIMAACEGALAEIGLGAPAADRLLALGEAYAQYALAHPRRFDALFTHRAPPTREFPESFEKMTADLFDLLGATFASAATQMPPQERALAARALWASVHGIVNLGLQDRVGLLTREQILPAVDKVVRAAVRGMTN
ncbi:MAG: TetR-like C-terminal domain-containing protein [Beijerinckiaceae bacterium]